MADSAVRTRLRRRTRGDIKRKIRDWAPIVTGLATLCFSIVNALVQRASDHRHATQEQAYHAEEQLHYAEAQKHYLEEQQRIAIQDMPVISVEQDVNSSDPIYGIYVSNKSPVIARLKNLTFIVNGGLPVICDGLGRNWTKWTVSILARTSLKRAEGFCQ